MTTGNSFDPAKHARILAVLFGLAGSLLALLSILMFVMIAVPKPNEDPEMLPILHGMFAVIGIIGLILSALPAIGSWALFTRKRWARVYSIVLSVLYLPTIPVGTALGIYGLWALTKPESRKFFEDLTTHSSGPGPAAAAVPVR